MSGLDGVQLDPDGFVDMDQFPDDGTDLSDADLASLRDALHSDPVEEPTAEQWDAMFDEALAADDSGPFALDDGVVGEDAADTDTDDGIDPVDDATDPSDGSDASDESDAGAPDVDDPSDGDGSDGDGDLFDLDGTDDVDLGLDGVDLDGGLDLAPDDAGDDAFSADVLDDAPADIANNDFEDLL